MSRLSFESQIAWLAGHFDQPGLTAHANTLFLHDLPIVLGPDAAGTGCIATVDIGTADPGDTVLLEAMLGANLFGDGHGTSALGMDATGAVRMTLCATPAPGQPADLADALVRLAGHAGRWRKRLAPRHSPDAVRAPRATVRAPRPARADRSAPAG